MTVLTKKYSSKNDALIDKKLMQKRNWRAVILNTLEITYVNGNDIPQPQPTRNLTEIQFIRELADQQGVNIT